jgi:hypothetical protein
MLVDINEPLRGHLRRLYELIAQYGHHKVRQAVVAAISRGTPRSESVAHLLGSRVPQYPDVPLHLPDRKNVNDLVVKSHDLAGYDELYLKTQLDKENENHGQDPS